MRSDYDLCEIKGLDSNAIIALLLVGIVFAWSAFVQWTQSYVDLGISMDMMYVVNSTLSGVALVLSLVSLRRSFLRFGLLTTFISLMAFVTSTTPLITGMGTEAVAIGLFMVFFCALAFLKNREWIPFLGSAVFLVTELLLWGEFGDTRTEEWAGFIVSGFIFAYYACGLIMFKELGKDYFRVISDSIMCEDINKVAGDIFETLSNYMLCILTFLAGVFLFTENISIKTSVPLLIVSSMLIVFSFYGLYKGFVPEGTFLLLFSIYEFCRSMAMILTGTANITLLAFIMMIPLAILLFLFFRRADPVNMVSVLLILCYFWMVSMYPYNPNTSALLIVVSLLQMYCSICRFVSVELGHRMPFHNYIK